MRTHKTHLIVFIEVGFLDSVDYLPGNMAGLVGTLCLVFLISVQREVLEAAFAENHIARGVVVAQRGSEELRGRGLGVNAGKTRIVRFIKVRSLTFVIACTDRYCESK